ncbi:PSME3-interacting protein-like isoform X1 [Portunus trituberculatus]|uniref:PSME3-interacting protein-like isoform X1 n=1 Tax=Portunus trituberculatus TaxID=210409 RepID=UPI001E1D1F29|nr:PSME3-interacting protein-like isoform X1 [Portunus trituberculatus]XP_045139433.1 PSME3-interacting protein-like isoform X1 [Portunus trituberculatus]
MSSGFITEKEVAERRRARQEEWEKNRTEDDPVEPPEEPPHDPRSLYERLQEQRQKKEEEYDEAHKFKNMVRGLEDDEVDFLELVDRSKLQEEIRVRTEENTAIAEYRKKVSEMQKNIVEEEIRAEMKAAEARRTAVPSKRQPSHLSLLAGAIKRKTSEEDRSANTSTAGQPKRQKTGGWDSANESPAESSSVNEGPAPASQNLPNSCNTPVSCPNTKSNLQCIAVLPGLGVYTDSSDSDNNVDSDSDEDEDVQGQVPQQPRDITGRIVKPMAQCSGQQGC